MRPDGRAPDELRPTTLEKGVIKFAEGSCLIKAGDTHMLCTATVEDRVPPFLKGTGQGWVTAEYSMLPRSGRQRNQRDSNRGANGRSLEIQRLVGRSLRAVVDLSGFGERTITIDWMLAQRMIKRSPLKDQLAAVSVGVYRSVEVLDLNYDEDSTAHTDMNVVMTSTGKFVEVQGTAESEPFSAETLGKLLSLARKGIGELVDLQNAVLKT